MKPTPYLNTYCLTPARRYADTPTRPFIWLQTLRETSTSSVESLSRALRNGLPSRFLSGSIARKSHERFGS